MSATTATELVWAPCLKCSGKGHIRGYEGIAGGVCFACGGSGGEHVESKVVARRKAARARTAAKRKADRAAQIEALDNSRRDNGWGWADLRGVCGQDSDADFMLVDLWEGHEGHAKFPGWARPDGTLVR